MNAQLKQRAALPPARILECTEEEYFADPCATPSLTQSIAHLMVSESPLDGWAAHPKLGNMRGGTTAALDEGKLLHKLMLGLGVDVVIVPYDNFKKKAAQEMRDAAIEAGELPVIARKYEEIRVAAEGLRQKLKAYGFPLEGRSEVAIEWYEQGANGPVVCRGRMDHVFINEGRIYDVKKTASPNPRQLARRFVEYGYDIQQVAYSRALAALNPAMTGRIEFTFLFMGTTPPYHVVPVRPDGAFREIGALRWSQAVRTWERCLATGQWPGYSEGVVVLNPPVFVMQEHLGNSDAV